jgi:predicted ArsR family transcriptional regulator
MSAPETIDSRTHRVLAGVTRVAVLQALRLNAGLLDVQTIAEQVGLHTNTVRSHLDQLMDAGMVESEVQERKTPGRPRLLFRATPTPGRDGPEDSYKVLAEILASGIRDGEPAPGAVAAKAGRRWGQRLARPESSAEPLDSGRAVDRVVALLDEVGFAPRVSNATAARTLSGATGNAAGNATVIELHQCPFYDIAREHTDVVCAVHLGLIQGALDQMQAPPSTVRIEPFVRPDLCLAHIAPAVIHGAGAGA